MDRQIIVFTADKRQERLVTLLDGEKKSDAWEERAIAKDACEKIYVLPIPVAKIDRNQEIKCKLKQELINDARNAEVKVKVFGGVMNEEWKVFLQEYKIPYWDFMKLPEVVEGNGWITAEATIAEVMQSSNHSICGQKVLVTGYGCCGQKIADVFARLGAKVTVVARRKEVCDAARNDGHASILFQELDEDAEKFSVEKGMLGEFNTIINTVPALVLREKHIRMLSSETIIIDIASNPGGTDFEAARRYGIKAKLALGLPGIYTTSSSALLLKNALSQYAPLQDNIGGDNVWIFQVII